MDSDNKEDLSQPVLRQTVKKYLNEKFNIEELIELCDDLNINHEEFGRDPTKKKLVRELILRCERNNALPILFDEAKKAVARNRLDTSEIQQQVSPDKPSKTRAIWVFVMFGLVVVLGLGILTIRTLSSNLDRRSNSAATLAAGGGQQIASSESSPLAIDGLDPATTTPSSSSALEATANAETPTPTTRPVATATPSPTTTNAPPIPPTQVIGVQTLPDGIRDQVSSVRVSGGCAFLYGSATSADEFLRVCEDITLLPPEWANHTKQVDADCGSGSGVINVTVYIDGDFKGEDFPLSFCE